MATAEHDNAPPAFRLQAKLRAFKTPASVIPEPEMLGIDLEMSGYQAWRRGCANRRPNGSIVQTKGNCHLNLVGKAGASHQITNRAPLCPCHNIMKGNRRRHLENYRRAIRQNGEMMVSDVSELIDAKAVYQCGNAKPRASVFLTAKLLAFLRRLQRSPVADEGVKRRPPDGDVALAKTKWRKSRKLRPPAVTPARSPVPPPPAVVPACPGMQYQFITATKYQ